MNRRSFLKLAIGAAVVVASGMELLETKVKPLAWNPRDYMCDFEFRTLNDQFTKVCAEIWHERYRAEYLKLAGAA